MRYFTRLAALSERLPMSSDRAFNRSGSGLAILAVGFIAILGGAAWLTGQGYSREYPALRLLGASLLLSSILVLIRTVRRWAGYFFAICALAAVKAALSLIFGVTVSSGHLVTNYRIVAELFITLIVLCALTIRFTFREPRSKLEVFSLTGGVVGLAFDMLTEPNFWPLRVAALFLAISWIVDRQAIRGRPHQRQHAEPHNTARADVGNQG